MQRAQARNLLPRFQEMGFQELRIKMSQGETEFGSIITGHLISGTGYFDTPKPIPFFCGTKRQAETILRRFGPQQRQRRSARAEG